MESQLCHKKREGKGKGKARKMDDGRREGSGTVEGWMGGEGKKMKEH